jgi:DNA-binding CsgD family transcriptional regulator
MTKKIEINNRDQRMLELLATGASSKVMAKKLGFRDGTMRVYLHGLYRKLGVANKTNAVIWYFDRGNAEVKRRTAQAGPAAAPLLEGSFGDFALRQNLYSALGAMNMFLGPYGRIWEVAARLKGGTSDSATEARRRQSRLLWEALLRGDFAYGKALADQGVLDKLCADSPSDGVLLAALLLAGGYARAGEKAIARLSRKKKAGRGITENERAFVHALRDALEAGHEDAMGCLFHLAGGKTVTPALRQVSMVAMFHAYRIQGDLDRARETANAICAAAEDARQQLQAMGERPLYGNAALPKPGQADAKKLGAYLKKMGSLSLATQE